MRIKAAFDARIALFESLVFLLTHTLAAFIILTGNGLQREKRDHTPQGAHCATAPVTRAALNRRDVSCIVEE